MKKNREFLFVLCLLFQTQALATIDDSVLKKKIKDVVSRGVSYLLDEQKDDGSWGDVVVTSSILNNAYTVLLYEYLDMTSVRQKEIKGLMNYIWSMQDKNGGLTTFPGGDDNHDLTVLAYLSALIADEPRENERFKRLEAKFLQGGAFAAAGFMSRQYLMLFGVDRSYKCFNSMTHAGLLFIKDHLPWIKTTLIPFSYLLSFDKVKISKKLKSIEKMVKTDSCHPYLQILSTFTGFFTSFIFSSASDIENSSFEFLDQQINSDGSLFDYVPTSFNAVKMYYARNKSHKDPKFLRSLQYIESMQGDLGEGKIVQYSAYDDLPETALVLMALKNFGYKLSDERLQKGLDFVVRHQSKLGGFYMSSNGGKFPDTDDTALQLQVIHSFIKDNQLTLKNPFGHDVEKAALDWLASLQNSDGGFGTWDKDPETFISQSFHYFLSSLTEGVVLAESIPEHTARVVYTLGLYEDERSKKMHERGIEYLIRTQNTNGSYLGTWFINYVIGTSNVLRSLATYPDHQKVDPAIKKGLEYIFSKLKENDRGWSESPLSYNAGEYVPLDFNCPRQTGIILAGLSDIFTHRPDLLPLYRKEIKKTLLFLVDTFNWEKGRWDINSWLGTVFPKVEYLNYPYSPLAATLYGMMNFYKLL